MNVSLTPELEQYVREKVESGMYASVSEVMRDALRLMNERDKLRRLRAAIAEADAEFERGEYYEWTPTLMEEMRQQAIENERRGVPIPDDVIP